MTQIGPFSSFDLESIKDILDDHGIKYDVISSPEKAAENLRSSSQRITPYPTFQGPHLNYFIELNEGDLGLVQPLLEKYGVPMTDLRGRSVQSAERAPLTSPTHSLNIKIFYVFILLFAVAVAVVSLL